LRTCALIRSLTGKRAATGIPTVVRASQAAHRFLSRSPLVAILPLFPRSFQLPLPLGLNLLLMPSEHKRNDESISDFMKSPKVAGP
jgi:hypothetical protein